jgi:hypothetical protein
MRRSILAMGFVVAAASVTPAADGMMKTRKLPSDAVAEPPAVEYKKLPTDQILAPEHLQPGTHTLTLEVGQSLPLVAHKSWQPKCQKVSGWTNDVDVGWGNVEFGDDSCVAFVLQRAIRFDNGPIDEVPSKTIDRAVLTYDETPSKFCPGLVDGDFNSCWQNGEGSGEAKPDGCVVVRVPSVAWYETAPPGLVPYLTSKPEPRLLGTREWDVTEPYAWQTVTGAAPLDATAGFGLLLTGSITSLAELEGDDDTICASEVSNVRLQVTYTVPEPSGPPPVIR